MTNNLIWVLKAIDIWIKSIYSLGQTIYYNWETYVLLIQITFDLVGTISMHFMRGAKQKEIFEISSSARLSVVPQQEGVLGYFQFSYMHL